MPDATHDQTTSPAETPQPTPDTVSSNTEHPFADPTPMTLGQGRRLFHQGRMIHEWVADTGAKVDRMERLLASPEKDEGPLTAYMTETAAALATTLQVVKDVQTLTRRLALRLERIEDRIERR